MQSRTLKFSNSRGEQLAARLELPLGGEPSAYALFAHCFTCSKNLRAVGHIARALAREGIATLRFDFTGLGESEGDFAQTHFSSNVADLLAAADYLAAEFSAPRLIIGHSLGGAAVLQAAGRIESVQAVATIGAPCDPAHVTHLLGDQKAEIEQRGEAQVTLGGRPFLIRKSFLNDLNEQRMAEVIAALRKPLLVLHSPVDSTVGVENAAHIFQSAKHPKSFVSLDQADHLLSREADARYAGAMIAAWAARYLDADPRQMDTGKAKDNRVLSRTEAGGFLTEICANGHPLVADEPVALGGGNAGPSPYELLVAALGACTSMTLQMYAGRKQWPLKSAQVYLHHEKIHARDCAACDSDDGMIDHIRREIVLKGPLDESQRARLLEIADRCPVHRSLHGEIHVITELLCEKQIRDTHQLKES